MDDFAGLAVDDFYDIIPKPGITREEVSDLIMQAREKWFSEDA